MTALAFPIARKPVARFFKACFDRICAALALLLLSPLLLLAALGVKCSSRGPLLYKAKRMGKNAVPFTVFKFRTMRLGADSEGAITATRDNRVFPWGAFLRKTKIDELPQLWNILNGSMSIVGPRPEDIGIVERFYTPAQLRTLEVLPGLACPGSIFNYTHGDLYLDEENTCEAYVTRFLPVKLGLDLVYLENWSLFYDFRIILRTIRAIFHTTFFRSRMDYPPEFRSLPPLDP